MADFAYVATAGDYTEADNVSLLAFDGRGAPSLVRHVAAPPDPGPIAVSPDGRWLVLGSSPVADLRSYAIDGAGGLTLDQVIAILEQPTSVAFWPP